MSLAAGVSIGDWAQVAGTVLIAVTVVGQFVYNRRTIEISRSINFKTQWTDIYDAVGRAPESLEMIGIKKESIGKDINVQEVIAFWLLHNFFQHWMDATGGPMNRETCPTFFDMMGSEMGAHYWRLTEHTFTSEWRDIVAEALAQR
ncbi:MAG: hypothetical protein ACKOCC_00315 [Actinomycetota bacterium]